MNVDEIVNVTINVVENGCTKDNINNVGEYLNCSKMMFEHRLKNEYMKQSSLDDFILHKTIGVGAFGRVLLVNHKSDDKKFLAMKVRYYRQYL